MPSVQGRGASISCQVTGNGPAVLMIQGVGVCGSGWGPQIDGLSDRYRIITFDNRGIGASTRQDPDLTIKKMADDAEAVADAAGADRFHLVGHSMGGLIAQELALREPSRIMSLCLMCTFARGRDGAAMTPRMLWLGLRTRLGSRTMRRNAFLQMVMPRAALKSIDRAAFATRVGELFGHDLADTPSIVMPQLRAMREYDAYERLASLRSVPTLVMSGRHDPIARRHSGEALVRAIPGARHVEFKDASHGLPIQFADEVNRRLAEHWAIAEAGDRS